jgi:hypothetical protein
MTSTIQPQPTPTHPADDQTPNAYRLLPGLRDRHVQITIGIQASKTPSKGLTLTSELNHA